MEKAETPTESERVLRDDDGGPDLEEGEPYLKPVKRPRARRGSLACGRPPLYPHLSDSVG